MKKLLFLIAVLFFTQEVNSQTGKYDDSRFRISFSKGITYNFENNIRTKESGQLLNPSISAFNVDLTSFEIGYFISTHHEIGVSIGNNLFTEPDDFAAGYGISYPDEDTTYFRTSGHKFISMTWISLDYNFHFLDDYKTGLKIGTFSPSSQALISLSIGKYYRISNNFLADLTLSYSNRSRQFKNFKSHQISLSLGMNLKI